MAIVREILIGQVNEIYHTVHNLPAEMQNTRNGVKMKNQQHRFRAFSDAFCKKSLSTYLLTSFQVCGMISS